MPAVDVVLSSQHSINDLPDQKFGETVKYLVEKLPDAWRPRIAVVCGSGLGGLKNRIKPIDSIKKTVEIDYSDIPHFSRTTVPGHSGKLVFGLLNDVNVVCMVGRFHFYEGHVLAQTTYPIRIFSLLGVQTLLVTNASGSLNSEKFKNGDIMIIKDHINIPGMAGNNPLMGHNLDRFGPRFPATSDAYNVDLRRLAQSTFSDIKREQDTSANIHEGVYVFVAGPSYETPHEARFLRIMGADAVGMSTVPEVIVARHCGMQVLGLSLITNKVFMPDDIEKMESGSSPKEKANHEEVLLMSQHRALVVESLVERIIKSIK